MTAADSGVTNIAAVLTPPGVAAIAVIRLSGPLNAAFATQHLARPVRSGRCVHCDLRDGDRTIDDVLAVQIDDARLDLNVHGGIYVVQTTLDLVQRFGYEIVDWKDVPDVTIDATDRMERETLYHLLLARTPEAIRVLTAQPAAWRELAAHPSEDTLHLALTDTTLERLLTPTTVAIIGPPNVGKSTLANALFGRDRSITADLPGTTRDWVGEDANLDGLLVRLIDTPGQHRTDDPIEAAAIALAAPVVAAADLVVVAIDGSTQADSTALRLLSEYPTAVIVRTKSDRPSCCKVGGVAAINVSAHRGDGLAELRARLRTRLGCVDLSSPHARCWIPDQRAVIRSTLSNGQSLFPFIASPGVYNRPRPPERGWPLA